jgi:hypothetical protein
MHTCTHKKNHSQNEIKINGSEIITANNREAISCIPVSHFFGGKEK